MNATNESEGESNIAPPDTDTNCIYVCLDGNFLPIRFGVFDKSDASTPAQLTFNNQDPIYYTIQSNAEEEGAEFPITDLQQVQQLTIVQQEEAHADSIKLGEENEELLDFEIISRAKLYGSSPLAETDISVSLLNAIAATSSEISPIQVTARLPQRTEEAPETLISVNVLTQNLGKLSKVEFSCKKRQVSSFTVLDGVQTYWGSSEADVVVDDKVQNIPWGKITLSKNSLLIRHPALRYNPDQSPVERLCLFPSQTKTNPHSLVAGVISYSPNGLFIKNRTLGPVESYITDFNVSDMNPEQVPRFDKRKNFQVQLVQVQQATVLPNTHLANMPPLVLSNPFRLVYAINPKFSPPRPSPSSTGGNNAICVQHTNDHIIGQNTTAAAATSPSYTFASTSNSTHPHANIIEANLPQDTRARSFKVAKVAKAKPCRKQTNQPTIKKARLNQSRKRATKVASSSCNSEFSNVSVLNGLETQTRTVNMDSATVLYNSNSYDPSSTVIRGSPVMNNSGTFPQQYLLMPQSSLSVSEGSVQQQQTTAGAGPYNSNHLIRERFIEGHEAVCHNCGTRSRDLHFCDYCRFKMSPDAKLVALGPNSKPNIAESTVKKVTNSPAIQKRKSKKGKRSEECIVLSSDDEDQPKPKVSKSETKLDASSVSNNSTSAVVKKELKINLSQPCSSTASGSNVQRPALHSQEEEEEYAKLINEIQESLNASSKETVVKVECRSVRVGDYKCSMPSTTGAIVYQVIFSQKGIVFTLPHAQAKHKMVTCVVPMDTILMVEAHFKKNLPVLFMATGLKLASSLRKSLGLSEDSKDLGYHYGPQDGDRCQKRIVFLFTTITEQAVGIIVKIFGRTLSEIDNPKANQILCDITRDPQNTSSNRVVSSGKSKLHEQLSSTSVSTAENTVVLASSQVDCSENKTLLSYQGISVLQMDVLCLADEQFLNDSILDFWLRYIEHELLSPEDRARTYIFSTFFYKRLTTRPKKRPNSAIEEDPTLSASEKRHSRVKRWTKNVDIFEKDFLIIPINESLHWFLAVICFPGLLGVHDLITGEPLPNYNQKRKRAKVKTEDKAPESEPPSNGCSNNGNKESSSEVLTEDIPGQDRTEISRAVRVKKPCIIVFDSLAVEARGRVYSTLREYLRMEYKTRKLQDRDFTKTSMPGNMPKVPQQPNHCDCGIYTLVYVECFFKRPLSTFDISTDKATIWPDDDNMKRLCSTKRESIYTSIQELVKSTNPDAIDWIPRLTFTLPPISKIVKSHQDLETGSATIESVQLSKENSINIKKEEEDTAQQFDAPPIFETTHHHANLQPSTVESARASPADNDHDHDYFGVPPNK
ncbi:uncharacterized protein LOC110842552 isoform X4 [Folsomia candida]|uniref:uncharacterized protein LOC110842552 isoform X4 n=1 Tax=Folsomia candida TaxID=158441 RepID=UPI00160556D3|nr:uncharacterized protein LOC110842552 isoform X4 [Folsomia candida]